MSKKYYTSKYYNSGMVKWGKPVIVPDYPEETGPGVANIIIGALFFAFACFALIAFAFLFG